MASGLRPDWQTAWAALEAKLVHLIKSRIVVGFFIGDELFPGKISLADFTTCLAALATTKAQFPWLWVGHVHGGVILDRDLGVSGTAHLRRLVWCAMEAVVENGDARV